MVTALSHRLSKRTCAMAIFNADKKLVASDFQAINLPWQGPFIKSIGENKWVYATTADQQVQMSCVTGDRRTQT